MTILDEITLRDFFAAFALAALANPAIGFKLDPVKAYELADKMLAVRAGTLSEEDASGG